DRGERLHEEGLAHRARRRVRPGHQEKPGEGGEDAGEHEGEHLHPLHVDPGELRDGLGVSHGLRPVAEDQLALDEDRDDQGEQSPERDRGDAEEDGAAEDRRELRRAQSLGTPAGEDQRDAGEDEHRAERDDEARHLEVHVHEPVDQSA
ncbi:hypothetical protein ABE10_00805, partial [Bacillus toyonensis]|nr:hypothetical protein [Bacillus toyonensis]